MRNRTNRQSAAAMGLVAFTLSVLFCVIPGYAGVTTLHSFGDGSVGNDGWLPTGTPLPDGGGDYYGTTQYGGADYDGTVFEISSSGGVNILHSFGDGSVNNDGNCPQGALVFGSDGSLYGTTEEGGANDDGTIFKISTQGSMSILHSFSDGSVSNDGSWPEAGLVLGSDGNFYGTTSLGGAYGKGTVFNVTKSGAVTILHSFGNPSTSSEGANPQSPLLFGKDGNFYGTTYAGGAAGDGTLFEISPAGAETVLHSFNDGSVANDAREPESGVIQGVDGNLYGTSSQGGTVNVGTVYKAVLPVTGRGILTATVTILHSFGDGSTSNDGQYPFAGLIQGADLNLYGTTELGGATANAGQNGGAGYGTAYRISTGGAVRILHSFNDGTVVNDGIFPWSAFAQASDGSFVGSATGGGAANNGDYFDLTATSGNSRFDFNGDAIDDLLWQNDVTGQLVVWDMNGTNYSASSGVFATTPSVWQVRGVGDINSDGHPDILFWNNKSGQMLFWEMDGTSGTQQLLDGAVFSTAQPPWQPVSMADFDGDGNPDILLRNSSTGQLVVWYMTGQTYKSTSGVFQTVSNTNWFVAGTADFDGDGHPDILWENSKTGQLLIWYMNGTGGTTIKQAGAAFATVANTAWQVVSTGDVDGDGHPDITWRNSSTGQTLVWLMTGAMGTTTKTAGAAMPSSPPVAWHVVGVR